MENAGRRKASSSRVALKASTRWWGSLRIKPTVSERRTVQVSEISKVRVVVSRVSKRRLLAGMSAPVKAVEQGGLARVGIAHDGHHGHLVLHPGGPAGRPGPGGPPPAPPCSLAIFRRMCRRSVSSWVSPGPRVPMGDLPPEAVWRTRWLPHARQPGQQVFILGQLHLQAGPLWSGPAGRRCPGSDPPGP